VSVQSAHPSDALRKYVRAYAQRDMRIIGAAVVEPVPPRLEQLLEFEFGDPFPVCFCDGQRMLCPKYVVIGLQTKLRAEIVLTGQIHSFAIFFQPSGFWQLFGIPIANFINQAYEAQSVLGTQVRSLWNRMGETSFSGRVAIVEEFLLKVAARVPAPGFIAASANQVLQRRGMASVDELVKQSHLSQRQFERRFTAEIGLPPKLYSRLARFQAALDAKVARPDRTWLEIAHDLGYFDQMHLVHDCHEFCGDAPNRLFARLGNARPHAVALPQQLGF
jgi:AraC-like DNA-binding protein